MNMKLLTFIHKIGRPNCNVKPKKQKREKMILNNGIQRTIWTIFCWAQMC